MLKAWEILAVHDWGCRRLGGVGSWEGLGQTTGQAVTGLLTRLSTPFAASRGLRLCRVLLCALRCGGDLPWLVLREVVLLPGSGTLSSVV